MPVATLTYQLPEEREEHAAALAGQAALACLDAVEEHIRQRIKHGEIGGEAARELEAVRAVLHEWADDLPR